VSFYLVFYLQEELLWEAEMTKIKAQDLKGKEVKYIKMLTSTNYSFEFGAITIIKFGYIYPCVFNNFNSPAHPLDFVVVLHL